MAVDIEKLREACQMMHKTGTDDSQYMLVRLSDLEDMIDGYERDQILQEWMSKVVHAVREQ